MKKSSVAIFIVAMIASFASFGIGHADRTCNSAGSCEDQTANTVTCANSVGGDTGVAVTMNGAEVCNQANGSPLQGRIGAEGPSNGGCDCAYADGTAGNPSPTDGWVKVDGNGITCSGNSGAASYDSPGAPDSGDPSNC